MSRTIRKTLSCLLALTFLLVMALPAATALASELTKYEAKVQEVIASNLELMSYMEDKIDYDALAQPYTGEDYAELNAKAVEITASCTTDYDKAYAINKWVAENVYYDLDYYVHGKTYHGGSAIDVFENGLAVCHGYALLMRAMCRAAGLPARYASGDAYYGEDGKGGGHAWVEVHINGEWKMCDPTWDSNNRYEYGEKKYSASKDKYFLQTNEQLSEEHYLHSYDDTMTVGDYTLEITNLKKTLSYIGTAETLVIPEDIIAVTPTAFAGSKTLKEVTLPESMTVIPEKFLAACINLKTVNGMEHITAIGDSAFSGCDALETISISDKTVSIGKKAFCHCDSLTNIVIPDSVESLGESAFYCCDTLASAHIGKGVTVIPKDCFGNCFKLTTVTGNENVKSIEQYGFGGCIKLTSIPTTDNLEKLGHNSIGSCYSLATFYIGPKVTEIPKFCFSDCKRLKTITGAENVTNICYQAFARCTSLKEISIPAHVDTIGESAFADTTSLKTVRFDGTKEQWEKIDIGTGNDRLSASDVTIIFSDTPHTFTETVITPATCSAEGSKKLVCNECGFTKTEAIAKTEHTYTLTGTKAATCSAVGTKTYTCSVCSATKTEEIAKTAHSYKYAVTKAATCTESGIGTYTCSVCSDKKTETIPATGHTDTNADNVCDSCGTEINKTDSSGSCSHICHKGGISGFFWKIINLFNKLFKINQFCSCGKAHW